LRPCPSATLRCYAAARRFVAAQRPEADLRRLARLAAAFSATTPEMLRYLPTPSAP
jgi:hypothetical protein